MKRRILPWLSAVFVALGALLVVIPATASAAGSTGFVSLGNLSASPTPVDIYLYSSGDSSPQVVDRGVPYGTVLPYQQVNAGGYSVKMRTAGSSASSNPVWSVSLTVQAGGTYTVVPLRTSAQQGSLKVIDNNLTTPNGKSLVRVIQADINQKTVTFHCSCAPGTPGNITTNAAPGSVSPQAPIPAGTWTMSATGPSANTSLPVTLTAGTVHTEIVIAAPGGGIQIVNLTDAAGPARRPREALPPDSAAPHRTPQAHQYFGWRSSAAGCCWPWPAAGGCAVTRCVRSPRAEDAYRRAGRDHLGGRPADPLKGNLGPWRLPAAGPAVTGLSRPAPARS